MRAIPKYHYRKEDFESLCSVAKAMLSLVEKDADWDHRLIFVGRIGNRCQTGN